MNIELCWLWISSLKGIGRKKIDTLIEYFGSPKEVWNVSEKLLNQVKILKSKDVDTILNSRDEYKIKVYAQRLYTMNIKIYSIDSDLYPSMLKNIFDPPYVLYVKGNLPKNNSISLGVVGARKCTEYGRIAANNISKELAKNNITIVSGMARGIDTAAHKGTLAVGGKTIAVLGSGLDVCYPKENYTLMKQIEKNGAIISEFSPGTKPLACNFPMRNRIISGLSNAVIVIEAAQKSGSLITADQALEQGRDVYALPGNIYSKMSEGTNNLIRQGAKILTSYHDVLEDFYIYDFEKNEGEQIKLKLELEKNEKMIYDYLSLEPKYIDDICRGVNLPINIVQYKLTMLELNDYIIQLPNKRFIKKV